MDRYCEIFSNVSYPNTSTARTLLVNILRTLTHAQHEKYIVYSC